MSTSGTIGSTIISTDQIIEHSIRRCGLSPATQTPENLSIAKENLYLLILALLNEGINLWLIQHSTIGLEANRSLYILPTGTVDLLNAQYSTTSLVTGTNSSTATTFQSQLSGSTTLQGIGFKFSAVTASSTVFLEQSPDGAVWSAITSETRTDWTTNKTYWYRFTTIPTNTYFRVRGSSNITVTAFLMASTISDIPMYPYNRDDYLAQSNKSVTSRFSSNYYYEKLLNPQITLWPVPSVSTDFLSIATQRQIQDVGSLTQQLEVPERWKEVIIWQLSDRLAFELPGVTAERAQLIKIRLDESMRQVGIGETDGTTTRIAPDVGAYTK